jgi:ribosomal protein S18 acetylase RimI-like enzyme
MRSCFDARWRQHDFECFLSSPKASGFAAHSDRNCAGYALFEIRGDALGRERLQLIRIAVHPRYQQRGVGSRLLQLIKAGLRSEDETLPHQRRRERILCEVSELNVAAQMFLKTNGFSAVSLTQGFFADGSAAVGMEFRLVPRQTWLDRFGWRRALQR